MRTIFQNQVAKLSETSCPGIGAIREAARLEPSKHKCGETNTWAGYVSADGKACKTNRHFALSDSRRTTGTSGARCGTCTGPNHTDLNFTTPARLAHGAGDL